MATIFDPNKQKDNNLLPSSQPSFISSQQQPQQSPKVAGSGQFQNLRKFIAANQGAGQQIGQQLQSNIGKETEQAKSQIEQSKQAALKLGEQERQRIAQAKPFTEYVAGGLAAGAHPLQQGNNEQAFQQLRSGITKDINLGDTGKVERTIKDVGQLAQQTETEKGRLGLLDRFLGAKPGYTRGAASLDQLFLQTSPEDVTRLQQKTAELTPQLQQQLQQAQQTAQQEQANIQSLGQQAKQEAEQSLSKGLESLRGRLTSAGFQANEIAKNVTEIAKSALSGGTIKPEDVAYMRQYAPGALEQINDLQASQAQKGNLAITQDILARLAPKQYNVSDAASLGQLASEQDLAAQQALQRLGAQGTIFTGAPGSQFQQIQTGRATDLTDLASALRQSEAAREELKKQHVESVNAANQQQFQQQQQTTQNKEYTDLKQYEQNLVKFIDSLKADKMRDGNYRSPGEIANQERELERVRGLLSQKAPTTTRPSTPITSTTVQPIVQMPSSGTFYRIGDERTLGNQPALMQLRNSLGLR